MPEEARECVRFQNLRGKLASSGEGNIAVLVDSGNNDSTLINARSVGIATRLMNIPSEFPCFLQGIRALCFERNVPRDTLLHRAVIEHPNAINSTIHTCSFTFALTLLRHAASLDAALSLILTKSEQFVIVINYQLMGVSTVSLSFSLSILPL